MCVSVPNWHIVPIMQSFQPLLSVHDTINCCCRNVPKAQDIWDDIVMAYPTDILALKMLSDYSTFYGPKERVRDSVARVFPHWKQDAPLYGYSNGNFCGSGDIFKFSKWLISIIKFIMSLYQFALRVPLISFVWNLMVWWIKTKMFSWTMVKAYWDFEIICMVVCNVVKWLERAADERRRLHQFFSVL